MKKIYRRFILLIIASVFLVGCNGRKIKVGYTIYPVKYLLEKIGQDKVETYAFSDESMVLRSQLADDYKKVLKEVDTLFILGELEPYMDIINQDLADINTDIIDLSIKSGVFDFTRLTTIEVDNQKVEVKNSYYENPIFDSIDKYTRDPYLWLDPITMTSMANQVKDYLIEKDPDNTGFYDANFEKLKVDLAYLDADFLALRNREQLRFATMTPSFGIWQNNYNFLISPIILSKYGVLPTQQQLELIKVRLVNDDVNYLIVDDKLDKDIVDLANEIAEELDLELVNISSLSYRNAKQKEQELDYIQIMNANLTILEELQEKAASQISEIPAESEELDEDKTE